MIHTIYDFLEQDVYDSLINKFESSKGQAVFEVNNMGRWGTGLEAGSYSPVLVLPLDEYQDYFKKKYSEIDERFAEHPHLTCFMHVWLPGSQINWHHDSPEETSRMSSSIYLNANWDWNWGGLFLYDDEEMPGRFGWVFPHKNSAVYFKPPIWHSTTMVTNSAPYPRLSVQLFFSK
jgi:Rps23 Pro-64 3,4-dihydroxylase Tpa1-like proline 4-hydroxylase